MFLEAKLEGRRGRGRPRLRWINDVEDDLRKLGVKWWRTKVLDRVEWASIIRGAKAKLKGPWRYRKKKKKKKKKNKKNKKTKKCFWRHSHNIAECEGSFQVRPSVRPFVRPHGETGLSLDTLFWDFFAKKNSCSNADCQM
jgi:hypothetical protein